MALSLSSDDPKQLREILRKNFPNYYIDGGAISGHAYVYHSPGSFMKKLFLKKQQVYRSSRDNFPCLLHNSFDISYHDYNSVGNLIGHENNGIF